MPLDVQSSSIPLSEWLAQFTLCFAPYATHVFTGIPPFVYLQRPGPSWHHIVNFFNPTTILWRYLMILDRRLRCTRWTPYRFAATNAAFWTGHGWRGDQWIMDKSEAWNLVKPDRTRARFLSISVIGTLIVVVQGVQALYELSLQIKTGFTLIQSVAGIFVPLAVISLTRLPPAPWLTNELAYREVPHHELEDDVQLHIWRRNSNEPLNPIHGSSGPLTTKPSGIRSQRYLPAFLVRTVFLLVLAALVAIGVGHVIFDDGFSRDANLSVMLLHVVYQVLIIATLLIFSVYLAAGRGDTTIIPCIGSWWYTAYTILWYLFVVVTIVVNALETRRTSCGFYTTWPVSAGLDGRICGA